ncbi:H-NS histone family protein [Aquabacterium sp.]|uniref:H-NS histone family protein n=1 Tax=Aquabacterium sp. TaxID=1872578 RepID=UPI002489272D|nr:H-NS histone family protein [Aquabacterium sp.]MDI1258285.1 H-NS histone family protein [Aquabacterium sp.]
MTSVSTLLARQAELEEQTLELERELAAAKNEERNAVIVHIREAMKTHGLMLADLGPKFAKYAKEPSVFPGTGQKVAPKYRNPSTGETWSGRGNKPRWLQAEVDAGSSVESFLI